MHYLEDIMVDPIKSLLKKDQIIGVINDLFVGTDKRDWARSNDALRIKSCSI